MSLKPCFRFMWMDKKEIRDVLKTEQSNVRRVAGLK